MTFLKFSFLILLPLIGLSAQSEESEKNTDSESIRDFHHYRISDVSVVDTYVSFGLGEMTIAANSHSKRFDGSMEYSPKINKPEITYEEQSGKGILNINQNSEKIFKNKEYQFGKPWKHNIPNRGEFYLPPDVDLNPEIEFGLGEATLDFSGLTINSLKIECGLGEMEISVDHANSKAAEYLQIDAGLGAFVGNNLGNLRAKSVSIDVGLGEADIDMRGQDLVDTEIDISVGLGSLELTLPEKANIRIDADHNFLSSVEVYGLIRKNGRWQSHGWNKAYPTITVEAEIGIGAIEIRIRD